MQALGARGSLLRFTDVRDCDKCIGDTYAKAALWLANERSQRLWELLSRADVMLRLRYFGAFPACFSKISP